MPKATIRSYLKDKRLPIRIIPATAQSTHPFAVYIASTPQGLGYPTMVFLDEESNMIQPISGYLTPQQLEPILSFFGTNAYKSTDWNTYYNSFKSSISQ